MMRLESDNLSLGGVGVGGGRVIGIDLGTTFSAVAQINDLGKPELLYNRDGERITPSVVFFQDDTPIVGTMAKRSAATAPSDVIEFVKRYMGDPNWKFMTSTGEVYGPEEVSAIILRRLKEDAELALGSGPITDAVITVPAYFDDTRRRATINAGQIAGLNVHRVLNEPTAAALAYGLDTQIGGTLLVYDLGGGTFDVTVMRIGDGEFDVLATGGDRNLGGLNWDNELMQWLNNQYIREGGHDLLDDMETVAELRERAELAKRSLTTVPRTSVIVGRGDQTRRVELTRETFEDITRSLLNRTRDIAVIVLEDSGLNWEQIDRILLAGGSTRMPMVPKMVESLSTAYIERSINPDEVVAMGAAVQAHLTEADHGQALPDLWPGGTQVTIKDVTSHSLGVVAIDADVPGRLVNSIIIRAQTKIPAKQCSTYFTTQDNQTAINVQVTEGEDEDLDYVTIKGAQELAIPPYPSGAPVEVTFAYDIDQTIFVEVKDLTTGEMLGSFQIDDVGSLSKSEIADRRAKVAKLDVV